MTDVVDEERDVEWRHYWKLLNDGLVHMTVTEFKDEMDTLGWCTDSPALKKACAAAVSRYDSSPIARAANIR